MVNNNNLTPCVCVLENTHIQNNLQRCCSTALCCSFTRICHPLNRTIGKMGQSERAGASERCAEGWENHRWWLREKWTSTSKRKKNGLNNNARAWQRMFSFSYVIPLAVLCMRWYRLLFNEKDFFRRAIEEKLCASHAFSLSFCFLSFFLSFFLFLIHDNCSWNVCMKLVFTWNHQWFDIEFK